MTEKELSQYIEFKDYAKLKALGFEFEPNGDNQYLDFEKYTQDIQYDNIPKKIGLKLRITNVVESNTWYVTHHITDIDGEDYSEGVLLEGDNVSLDDCLEKVQIVQRQFVAKTWEMKL